MRGTFGTLKRNGSEDPTAKRTAKKAKTIPTGPKDVFSYSDDDMDLKNPTKRDQLAKDVYIDQYFGHGRIIWMADLGGISFHIAHSAKLAFRAPESSDVALDTKQHRCSFW